MNKLLLNNFKLELSQISEYLKHIQYVNDILDYNLPNYSIEIEYFNDFIHTLNTLKEYYIHFGRDKKIFEYKAIIISLYGLLEKYIEVWIKEYLECLSRTVPNYFDIESEITDNHFKLSLKLIDIITSRELAKYQHLRKEEILNRLNQCIIGVGEYKFNTDAFVISSGNLRHNRIAELFKSINISLNDLLNKNETLINYIKEEQQVQNISNLRTNTLYSRIDDLVERRNEIAHGAETLYILDRSELEPYINFLEKYCQAIFEILNEQLIKQKSLHHFHKITKIIDVFSNRILAFEIENHTIRVGDIIIVETSDSKFFERTINTIEVDKLPYQEITITDRQSIGVSVEPKIKKNYTFYIQKAEN